MSKHGFEINVGSRAQVYHGTAHKTSGGLTKSHLMKNKSGRIVSKKKHLTAKKEKRLIKHGFGTKKGHFGAVKLGRGKSRKMKGGAPYGGPLSPSEVSGMENYSGNSLDVQIAAGMSGGKHKCHKGCKKHHRGGTGKMLPLNPASPLSRSLNA
jgi:hypothetical protein